MPTKKNNMPKGGFIRKQDALSLEQRAIAMGESPEYAMRVQELINQGATIQDLAARRIGTVSGLSQLFPDAPKRSTSISSNNVTSDGSNKIDSDIEARAAEFRMTPEDYISYYNRGLKFINEGKTIEDLVNRRYGYRENLIKMFPNAPLGEPSVETSFKPVNSTPAPVTTPVDDVDAGLAADAQMAREQMDTTPAPEPIYVRRKDVDAGLAADAQMAREQMYTTASNTQPNIVFESYLPEVTIYGDRELGMPPQPINTDAKNSPKIEIPEDININPDLLYFQPRDVFYASDEEVLAGLGSDASNVLEYSYNSNEVDKYTNIPLDEYGSYLGSKIQGYDNVINAAEQKISESNRDDSPYADGVTETEINRRLAYDVPRYGEFMSNPNAANRTGNLRQNDANIFFADVAKPNSVIIDIGAGLGNSDPREAGISTYELFKNPKIQQNNVTVIASDIAPEAKKFIGRENNPHGDMEAYSIPINEEDYGDINNFLTPITDILKDKGVSDVEDIYLRATNGIDIIADEDITEKHFEHIGNTLKDKNVTYVYNNMILYKPKGANQFTKIGNVANTGMDHRNPSWVGKGFDATRQSHYLLNDDLFGDGYVPRRQEGGLIGNLQFMPTDYMSGFAPNAMAQLGQTNNPRLFRGNVTGFPLRAGTEGANPELYIAAADAKFIPQNLYRMGEAIMPSFGVRGDVAYDRFLTPEVKEDIFRYTGRNISSFNTRFNPYIEVSGPRGNTVTGGVSFGGQVTPGGQSGLSYNVGYRKTFPVRKTKVTNQNLAEGGIFQNPITSAMNSFEEAGNLMIQNQLTDVLSQQIDDTFGFNFIPRDENGCEIKLMFKAQEGGYSRNQESFISKYLQAAREAAAENAGEGAGFIGRVTGAAVDMAKKAKENQSFFEKMVNDAMYKAQQAAASKAEEAVSQVEEEAVEPETTEAVTQPPVYSPENFYLSQTFKESNFDPNAVSSTNVHKGLGQLGVPVVTDWYFNTQEKNRIKKTSDGKFSYDGKTYNTSQLARDAAQKVSANRAKNEFDYFDAPLNAEVQMWAMDDLYNASFVHKPEENQPDEVRLAKALASYNMGRGKALSLLKKLKDNEVDIYSNTDFIVNSDYFPKETREYVAAIMYNKTPESWEERGYGSYEDALNKALANPEFQQYIDLYQTKQEGGFMENGGVLVSPEGVFDPNYIPGKPVIVPTKYGVITTEGVPMDLVAVSDLGEIKYLPRNSGTHQFKGKVITEYPADIFYAKDGGLADWFKEEWVRIDTEGNITGPCGTMKKGKATTRCLPKKKAQSLTKAERKATARKKVRGSKKGKQFVSNTKKAKVKKRDTKRYDDGGQAPLSESFVMIDVSKMDSPRESKAFTFADNLSQYSTATAASKALNVNDIRDFLKSEGYDVSLTDSKTLSADELSALNTYMTGQQSVMLDGGELPHQTFTRVTGLPWPEAKLRGYTDGSYEGNIALQQRILEGKSLFKRPNNPPKGRFSSREGLVEIDLGND